ncbi:MAG: SDR family oxidoreductase [Anaerolineaceae bacterium]|nr:SDR family oxidoreductase [Anaerolineaceae bacterium]
MNEHKAVAIVGLGAILPDAPDVPSFWKNVQTGRYSISEVPPERWDPNAYFSTDLSEPDKTYTKIGGWVRGFKMDLLKWGIPIPPTTLSLIDQSQQWAIAASRQALLDYGYQQRKFDPLRTAVIFGNAMAGENHYATSLRVRAPQYMKALSEVPEFQNLPPAVQQALLAGMQAGIRRQVPAVTEDTMPGELSNVIAGRVANIFNLSGPNFVTDAACASSFAALQAAIAGLVENQFDMALTGGIDRNMGVESFVKFCKIGALSPDGSRPYAEGANGFVMGEGGAVFLLKRLEDAERDGDKIYAVVRGVGGSSDGKGKGITAPNPIGQQRAIERAWQDAGLSPATASYFEGHGTSTRVGDVAEVQSLVNVLAPLGLKAGQIGLGSVKSNIGHLKSAAGAAGMLKTILSLHEQTLLPSVNFARPNPEIDFDHLPVRVETVSHDWQRPSDGVRRAGISSFGFGGTNFHVVIEEYLPGLLNTEKRSFPSVTLNSQPALTHSQPAPMVIEGSKTVGKAPYRGLLFLGANSSAELKQRLTAAIDQARQGHLPLRQLPSAAEVAASERIAIDYEAAEDLIKRAEKALKGFENDTPNSWQALTAQGVYRGHGRPGKVVFMFPGQGSQYVNMLSELRQLDGVVADTFREADEVMRPILGRPLSELIFVDGDEAALAQAEATLRDTTITQPAVLTVSVALARLLASYGYQPDLVIGHSLGEYAALVAAGVLTFAEALQIVSARGRAMTEVASDDNGCMAAVSAPIEKVEAILAGVDGYVVIANINSPLQCVIGGSTVGVDAAIAAFMAAGFQAVKIPVSHAFHTKIVGPAGNQLRKVVAGMSVNSPRLPVVANVTGELYPKSREEIIDMLALQVASPVQFIKSMQTLYREGGRVLVEVGPKRVLTALATDNLKGHDDVAILSTNHPRKGGLVSLNEALCGLLAAGVQVKPAPTQTAAAQPAAAAAGPIILSNLPVRAPVAAAKPNRPGFAPLTGSVVISGAGLGLPGRNQHVFDDENIRRILNGEQRIEALPDTTRQRMIDKRVTRLNKSEAGATLEIITDMDRTIKLAGQRGAFSLSDEFGVPPERADAYDIATQLAIGAGIDALRDAGIPLVLRYRITSKGTYLPDRWVLPPALADETGVIFGSAFPGMERMAQEAEHFYEHQNLTSQIETLRGLQALVPSGQSDLQAEFAARIAEMEGKKAELNYNLDRRFIFRILSMGHSQFAEYIGARGPNTQVNAACATTTQAVGIAEDWIRTGRCRRVIVIAGDDVTDGRLVDWVGTGLLASGATSTESDPRLAVLPFDRRRNGMIMGMGAAALVVEAEDAVRERGMRAICEILSSQIANSAFHGTRLDVQHVTEVMERVVSQAEERFGVNREAIAANTVFVSHETYTPARGGSAAAEIRALRQTFGELANQIVIANTKGYTGHTMGVGIEDVVAVKALENQQVPPIANIHNGFEPDPELGDLNLSKGGHYPVEFALRLGAGFGSQVAMTLLRRIPGQGQRIEPTRYNQWLAAVAGYEQAELETVQRTLRIKNQGAPNIPPARSTWMMGQGPIAWADANQSSAPVAESVKTETTLTPAPLLRGEGVELPPSSTEGRARDERKAVEASLDTAAVTTQIVALVSEKTGYPAEMLDLELDLEADLGIDTVKQAELFASVRGLYGIPRREDLRLSDYNTLAKVVGFVMDAKAISQTGIALTPALLPLGEGIELPPSPTGRRVGDEGKAAEASLDTAAVTTQIVALVSEKTGYPAEMLDLGLDLEADLGIDTVKQAELFASVRGVYGIPRREDLRLSDYNTLAKVVGFVMDAKAILQTGTTLTPAPLSGGEGIELPPSPIGGKAGNEGKVAEASLDPAAVTAQIVALVSAKTGYPAEMLDLELDLEADLGIDTVKQAELFASVRGVYGIPRREDLRLSDYNTLAKVVGFVMDATKPAVEVEQVEIPQPEVSPHSESQPSASPVAPVAEERSVSPVQRRIPLPVLRPRLDLCKPTGVTFDNTRRVVVVVDRGHISETLVRKLRGSKLKVLLLQEPTPEQAAEQAASWLVEGPIHGVYFLPAADIEPELPNLDNQTWKSELTRRVRVLYALMRALPGDPFLVCATRMGGFHGYTSAGPTAPLGGSVSGFAKAYAREHPNSLVKVVDYPAEALDRSIAAHLVDETLRDPGAIEIGLVGEQRFAIGLIDQPLSLTAGSITLDSRSVYLVTGGAGGITVPVVTDLARASGGIFYLTGRTALLDPADHDLVMLKNDLPALKTEIARRLKDEGQKATPAKIEQKIAALERADAVLAVLAAVQQAGRKALYRVCDVTDPAAVSSLVKEIVQVEGHLDVIIHAAGVDQSHRLENKSPEEFARVFDVKADGFYNLLKEIVALEQAPKAVVAFTSVAGRFGNFGQTDYSAANDLLCKLVSWLGAAHPEIKALALDWGAWAEVGMASRGNLPEVMRQSGIDMLPPGTTAPLVRAEILAGQSGGEVVLAGALGSLLENREHDGGLDLERANLALIEGEPIHEMLSRATGLDLVKGISLEAELDPQTEPFLKDHALNGIPVLPGVMGIEGFSVAATHVISVLGSSKAGFQVTKMEDVRFLAPFKFYRSEPRRITWHAQVVEEAGGLVAHVSLESTLALRSRPNEIMQHFSGRVYMRPLPLPEISALRVSPPHWNGAYTVDSETIYRLYFHGPAFQVLDAVQRSGDQVIGRLARNLPAMTSRDHPMLSAPVLIELCLQTAGIWEIGATGVLSLPSSIERLDLYEPHNSGLPIYAEVSPIPADSANRLSFNARVVDAEGRVYLELKNYRTSPLPYKIEDVLVQPLRELIENKD